MERDLGFLTTMPIAFTAVAAFIYWNDMYLPSVLEAKRSTHFQHPKAQRQRRIMLTSSGLTSLAPEARARLREWVTHLYPGGARVLYVMDAGVADGRSAYAMCRKMKTEMRELGAVGVSCKELSKLWGDTIQTELREHDLVYVDMGNTYYLTHHARRSSFAELLPKYIDEGRIAYVGASAGSILAGRSVEPVTWKKWDDPGRGTDWDIMKHKKPWAGIDLLDGKSVFPHCTPRWEARAEKLRRRMDHDVVMLDEDHIWVVDGDADPGGFIPALPGSAPADDVAAAVAEAAAGQKPVVAFA